MNQTYIVKAGDTLYGISNQFGVSVTELASLNNVNANTLQIGQTLKIPLSSGINPNNMFMYTVQKGDTLYTIAKKYNTTVNDIMKLNYLTNTNLSVGQVIRIPENYFKENEMVLPNYSNYVVKAGDNLYKIARENNIDVNTLIKDNALTSNNIYIGQNLKIRIPEDNITVVEECFGEDYTPPVTENYINYTVKRGDSLYSIANQYNTSVSDIKRINNLTSNNLSIGQILKLPNNTNNNTNTKTYTVQRGDNLYSIARKFNTTVNSIKSKNNLTSNLLSIGQVLKI